MPAKPDAAPAADAGPSFKAGAQAFLRGEVRKHPRLGVAPDPSIGQVLMRVRLQGLGTWGPVSVFAQMQDARVWGIEPSTTASIANTDLHQGYAQLGGTKGSASGYLRAGRQEINFGTQRMIGALGWMPNARSFDALRAHGEVGQVYADAVFAMLAPVGVATTPAADPADPPSSVRTLGSQLYGGLGGYKAHEAFNVEVLGLLLHEDPKDGALSHARRIHDLGPRIWGEPIRGLTYDVEAHGQFGRVNGRDHRAWAAAGNVVYMHKLPKVVPGATVGYAIASGEACTADPSTGACGGEKSSEFFNFYPTNHKFYGLADLAGWRNIRDFEAGLRLKVPQAGLLRVEYHNFQLQEAAGRWSNAGGANVGLGWDPTNTNRNLGHELDVMLVSKPWKPVMIQPGYGVFLPRGAGERIGGPQAQHYGYLWLVVTI